MNGSMIYTVGTALRAAMDNHQQVSVLVEGHWISGMVLLADSHGVLLDAGHEQSIVKLDAVTAVRMTPVAGKPAPEPAPSESASSESASSESASSESASSQPAAYDALPQAAYSFA